MKLQKFKDIIKNEHLSKNIETSTQAIVAERIQYNSDAKKLISLERLHSSDIRNIHTSQHSRNLVNKRNYDLEIEKASKVISYVPKNNVRFIPSDIKSYGNLNNFDFSKTNINNSTYNKMPDYLQHSKTQNNFFKFQNNNLNYGNDNSHAINLNNIDMDYLNFKTNFLLKFSNNINKYNKLLTVIETLAYNNKKIFHEKIQKLKGLAENKDKILLEGHNAKNQNITTWKNTLIYIYESENLWQKITQNLLKEFKKNLDSNIVLMKKVEDCEEELDQKNKKIEELNEFIRINDIHTKISKFNKTLEMVNDVKAHYEKKENKSLIEMFNMENQ